jgi:hypothetical protein
MKKLIFNGCSFMAGDELVWEQYHKEHNRKLLPWFSKKAQLTEINDIEFRNSYIEYRRNFNLPAMVSRKLECEWFDLSRDGKSNEAIALETIAYVNTIDKEERKNYHVIIGWSSLSRVMKYSKVVKHFIDLTAGHYDGSNTDPVKASLKDYIKAVILGGDDEDHISNYIRNIMLLENYLIVNNISYTFYRGIDDSMFDFKAVGPFDYKFKSTLQINDCTNHDNWYKFVNDHRTPINGIGWSAEFFNKPHMWVTPDNSHPGLETISNFSARLSEFIKTQQVL